MYIVSQGILCNKKIFSGTVKIIVSNDHTQELIPEPALSGAHQRGGGGAGLWPPPQPKLTFKKIKNTYYYLLTKKNKRRPPPPGDHQGGGGGGVPSYSSLHTKSRF